MSTRNPPPLPPVDPDTHHGLPDGRYWACQLPERPGGTQTAWSSEGCHACMVHLTATLHAQPTMRATPIEWKPNEGSKVVRVMLADAVAYEAAEADNPILIAAAASFDGDAERARTAMRKANE